MKTHDHDHPHGHSHDHAHEGHKHPASTATAKAGDASTDHPTPRHPRAGGAPGTASHGATHHHTLDFRPRGHDGTLGMGLLMTSSFNRVLGALALIALLWLAVAWAVLFID